MVKSSEIQSSLWSLITGVLMVILGLYIWVNPLVSILMVALYLGVTFIVIGSSYIGMFFDYKSSGYLIVGLLDIFIGIIFVCNLGISVETLPVIFALWSLTIGTIQLVNAWNLRHSVFNFGWNITVGLIGIIFAFLILSYPIIGTITITMLIGGYIMLFGLAKILEYLYLR